MRSLSDVLTKQRESRSLTIDQVAYETNISKKYIQALEEEEFCVFPAEAYLLGFLRNYADFLDLEYETIYAEYKNCLLREEDTPLSELIGIKKTFILKPWMVILPLLISAIAFGVPPLVKTVSSQIDKRKEALRIAGEEKSKTFLIDSDYTGKMVKEDDLLTLQIGDNQLTYLIKTVSSDVTLLESFKGEERVVILKLGNEFSASFLDEKKSNINVTLFLKDVGGFSNNSAVIKAKREIKEVTPFLAPVEPNVVQNSKNEIKTIMVKKHTTEPYTISIRFEGDILFRYQLKGQELKENFYQKDSVVSLDVTRSIQIWTSNAGLTKFKLNNETIVLGRTGEIHVFTLRWIYIKDKDEYRLEYAKAY